MRRSALEYIENKQLRKDVVDFRTGDTVRVHWKVKEGDKEREQPFEGVVIRKTKGQNRATFTVRKMSYGVGVERIFPLHSPRYGRIEVLSRGDVNRNRLFYLRALKGKASRVDTEETEQHTPANAPAPAAAAAPAAEGAEKAVAKEAKPAKEPKARAPKAAKPARAPKAPAEKKA
jgi:large subunit ribosomal protein L19